MLTQNSIFKESLYQQALISNRKSAKQKVRNVLHLRSSFDPGGTETLLMNLFNYPQDYFKMHFVLLKEGLLVGQLKNGSGNLFYKWYRKRFLDFSVLMKMHRLIKKEEIHLVHTHQLIELIYSVFLKMMNPRITLFHQVHLLFKKKDVVFYIEKFLCQTFACIITVSRSAKNEMVNNFGFSAKKIKVLYNGILQEGVTDSVPPVFKFPLKKNKVNIVMVANFVWGKDHATIFESYDSFIREQLPKVSIYFIGRESEISQELTEKHLKEEDIRNGRIVLCGAIPDSQSLLPLFDMTIMSSFSETFNMALAEAVSNRMTVLASDIPVFLELSENGKYFHHFKTGDPVDFFEKLKMILDKNDLSVNEAHAEYFKNKFGFGSFVEGLHEIYEYETGN